MKTCKPSSRSLAIAAALLVSPLAAAQDVIPVQLLDDRNLVGLGVFAVPNYYGSSNYDAAGAPILRYNFGAERYVQVLGPEVMVNLVPRKDWRAGPLLRWRPRRDDDVDDEIVARMQPVATATEVGAFVAYHMPLTSGHPLHKLVFSADIVGNTNNVYDGATGNLRVNYVHPFPQPVGGLNLIGTIGFGLFFASNDFNRKYFGIGDSDLALFPERAGVGYDPDPSVTSIKIPFSLTSQLNPQWLMTVGGRYERLMDDAKDSPLVEGRGDADQWTVGVAFSYLF
jgi:outer membrane scaffolding protein for murein synthesis (MipA/OmpV family)